MVGHSQYLYLKKIQVRIFKDQRVKMSETNTYVYLTGKLPHGNRVQEMLTLIMVLQRLKISISKDLLKIIFEELSITVLASTVEFKESPVGEYQFNRAQKSCDFVRVHKKVRDKMWFNEVFIDVKAGDTVLFPILLMSHLNVACQVHAGDILEFYRFREIDHPLRKAIQESNNAEIYYSNGERIVYNIPLEEYNGCRVSFLTPGLIELTRKNAGDRHRASLIKAGYFALDNPWK